MELTKKEKSIIKKALKEQYYIYKRYLDSHLKDLNAEQTNFTEEYMDSYICAKFFEMELRLKNKIKIIKRLEKYTKEIQKIILKLEAENGIKSSR